MTEPRTTEGMMILDPDFKPTQPPLCTHWTPKGVFKIYGTSTSGGGHLRSFLYLDSRQIYFSDFPGILASTLARGDYDDLIGFSTAKLEIPSSHNRWNNGKVPYDL